MVFPGKPLHEPKRRPQPGDWLAENREPGHPVERYQLTEELPALERALHLLRASRP